MSPRGTTRLGWGRQATRDMDRNGEVRHGAEGRQGGAGCAANWYRVAGQASLGWAWHDLFVAWRVMR